ncbi:MAG: hypothetical protein Q9220_007287 [cf. Caloplaca sp. 1 TL-2023]
MHFLARLAVAIPLLSSLAQAIPAELVERTFNIDATNCKRSQADRNLVTAEFLTARSLAQAAAGAVLDSNNKWANYFFDSGTLGKFQDSSEYYANISRLNGDTSYKVPVYCPAVGDAQYAASCRAGAVWAVAYARPASTRKIVLCPVWFDGLPSGTVKESSSKVRADCKPSSSASSKWQYINQFKFTKSFTLFHEVTHLEYGTGSDSLSNTASLRSKDYAYGRQNCSSLKAGNYENAKFCPKNSNGRYFCDPSTTFRNADSLTFVAAGIYWEAQCGKTIGFAPTSATAAEQEEANTEGNDAYDTPDDADIDVNSGTGDGDGGSGGSAPTSTAPTTAKAKPTKPAAKCDGSATFSTSDCNDKCGDGKCTAQTTTLGQLLYLCECP